MSEGLAARAKEIFLEAAALPPDERPPLLDERCGSNDALRAEVERLLRSDAATGDDFLEGGPGVDVRAAVSTVVDDRPPPCAMAGQRVGHFTIKELIASGGMGDVYIAVQEQPRRKVALKMMRRGLASRSALRRFEFESQTLGRLRHPNIAQVYEAGTHDDGSGGVPYFAMEYLAGARTLVDFANEKKLGTRERLELFSRVCDAVHHGHQKGVIHRDLKPSNIVVDSSGAPKIIDFGVARATDSDLAVTTLQTDVGQLIGTLQYMSPEQCAADPDDIDTRSDVYALGVVLYELLTDHLPYDVSRAVHEAVRVIQEQEPTRPSTLNRVLRGDAETITLKAMEKDRDRRYQSAADLGQDITRYLRNEPIEARPPGAMYRLSKFVRRNKAIVGGAAAAFVMLIVGTVVSIAFAIGESHQRGLAEQREADLEHVSRVQAQMLRDFDLEAMGRNLERDFRAELEAAMKVRSADAPETEVPLAPFEDLFRAANFTNLAAENVKNSVLTPAVELIERELGEQPLVQARLLETVGQSLGELGRHADALPLLQRAGAIYDAELPEGNPRITINLRRTSGVLSLLGRYAEAEACLRDALARRLRHPGRVGRDLLFTRQSLAFLLWRTGDLEEAETHASAALEGHERIYGPDDARTLTSAFALGAVLFSQDRVADAEPYYHRCLDGRRRVLGDDDPATLTVINDTGYLLDRLGRRDEARSLFLEALERRRRVLGDYHVKTAESLAALALLHRRAGQWEIAEAYSRQELEVVTRNRAFRRGLTTRHGLARALREQERHDEAARLLREIATSIGPEELADDAYMRPRRVRVMVDLAWSLAELGRYDDARRWAEEAVASSREHLPDRDPFLAHALAMLGYVLICTGDYEAAERALRESVPIRQAPLPDDGRELYVRGYSGARAPPDDWLVANAKSLLGAALLARDLFPEAEPLLLEGYEGLYAASTAPSKRKQQTLERVIDLYDRWHAVEPDAGHDATAAEWRQKLESEIE
ncbi:MAG: tetratricopeptide repeat protein [Planctomycetota bacterium]|jgi:serine/threonine protein kinase/tetratricopeptide (TPR) repeat protein